MGKQRYIVCYDVTLDKTRLKVDKLLQGFGVRIQKSVFECWLNRGEKAKLDSKLGSFAADGVDIRCFCARNGLGSSGSPQQAPNSTGAKVRSETGYIF